jgi:hypothetical protein
MYDRARPDHKLLTGIQVTKSPARGRAALGRQGERKEKAGPVGPAYACQIGKF